MSVRFIYNNLTEKSRKQYEQISNFFPNHIVYTRTYYIDKLTKHNEKVDYNIYLDTISEDEYNNLKAKFTIFVVNEEYINHEYLIRDSYIDKPLMKLIDIIDYYFCITKYAYKLLKKFFIDSKKIIHLNHLCNLDNIKPINKKYILFDIDKYSGLDNDILLDIWIKHFLNIDIHLIIIYHYRFDKLVYLFSELTKTKILSKINTYYYKNLIISNDKNIVNDYNIYATILHSNSYYLTTQIQENILKGRIIITHDNIISREYFDNNIFLYDNFNNIKKYVDILIEGRYPILYTTKVLKQLITNQKKNIKLIKKFNFKPIKEQIYEKPELQQENIFTDEAYRKTDLAHYKIKNQIIEIDKMFKKKNIEPSKYYRFLKNIPNKSQFGYCTSIFHNNSYLPGILASGYSLKNVTKNNIICFVQDKPYYDKNNVIISHGLNKNDIENIKKIYDVVVGVDLIVTDIFKINLHHTNLQFYCTKLLCFSFTYYNKLIYYDSSTLITKNIDNLFEKYDKSSYFNIDLKLKSGRGVHGAFLFIVPKLYYVNKLLYLLEKNILNNHKDWFSVFTHDEDHSYYTIYPNWNTILLDNKILENNSYRMPYINEYKLIDTSIQFYVKEKPFKHPISTGIIEHNFFTLNNDCYLEWDLIVQQLIVKYPYLSNYFKYIKTYRYTLFGCEYQLML